MPIILHDINTIDKLKKSKRVKKVRPIKPLKKAERRMSSDLRNDAMFSIQNTGAAAKFRLLSSTTKVGTPMILAATSAPMIFGRHNEARYLNISGAATAQVMRQ